MRSEHFYYMPLHYFPWLNMYISVSFQFCLLMYSAFALQFFLPISVCSSVCKVWRPRCPFCDRSLHDYEFPNEHISCFRHRSSLLLNNLSFSSALLLHTFPVNQIMLFSNSTITSSFPLLTITPYFICCYISFIPDVYMQSFNQKIDR